MKYTEFTDWCNERACDGCWGSLPLLNLFLQISDEVNSIPINGFNFFRKKALYEQAWQKINSEQHIEELIETINKDINKYKGVNTIN